MRHRVIPALIACLLFATMPAAPANQTAAQDATPAATPAADTVMIETADGPVQGLSFADYALFRGIPYAAPPVGELRWWPPQPVTPWTEPLNATESGSPCPQDADPLYGGDAGNEDCLYLEVTVPASATTASPKPVLIWLHGGGFIGAAGSFFDARRLATQGDLVVVSVNYRLGILGFFGYPGLEGSGNFGLQDQRATFEWVQRNIAAFGGDPGNVTIAGESAGAMSICAHLTAPGSEGLFHRAIIQSGPCTLSWPANGFFPGLPAGQLWRSPEDVEGLGTLVAEAAGCADPATAVDCLRRQSPADLLALELAGAYAVPAWGGELLPESPPERFRAGDFLAVPVISGNTRDEATFFIATFFAQPFTPDLYEQYLTEAFGDAAGEVAERYAEIAAGSPALAWARISTDRTWACPTAQSSGLLAARAPVFGYEFADPAAPPIIPEGDFPLGAYHSSEIPYLFDYVGAASELTPEQLALSDAMIAYWANFAHAGDPNGPGLPTWEPFDPAAEVPVVLSLAPGPDAIAPVDFAAAHHCAFWQEHGLE